MKRLVRRADTPSELMGGRPRFRGKQRSGAFLRHLVVLANILMIAVTAHAADHQGRVRFGEVPVPGAIVRATFGDRTLQTITDLRGNYSFPDLGDGTWTIQVEMPGFETARREAVAATDDAVVQWDLKMLPVETIKAVASPGFPAEASTSEPTLQTSPPPAEAADRLLINGSVSNGASTPFALARAFGNNRVGARSLYTGTLFVSTNNALFDARSFSLTGQNTPQPAYSRLNSVITFAGPFQIPSLFRNGNFVVSYSRTQNRNASVQTAQMPTAAERAGDFSQSPMSVIDPATGTPFAGNMIPQDRISAQARALVGLYPLPNFSGPGRYNYQIPILGVLHGDNFQGAINNIALNNANRISITAGFQGSRSDIPNLFDFTDKTNVSGTTASVTWTHRFTQRVSGTVRYQFNRGVAESFPYFGRRQDISGDAGILGNDRDPRNWGPPNLTFSAGIARLSDGLYGFDRNQSSTVSYTSTWTHARHALSYGGDFRHQQFNLFSQRDARGTFTFTGAATGNDFADFLLSIPTASSIAFGNADKYFRQSFFDAFVTDDWRIKPALTLTLGVRWEYEAPITERYGRLVNLEIAPGFVSATPVIAGTSRVSLIHPDKGGIEPRLGLAWRPRAASSVIVRAAYGVYRDTSVYRAIADQMAQQSPLSKSLSVQNTPSEPLTLADGFRGSPSVTATTFAIDPYFRVGNAQNWQLSIQKDLPSAMQMTVTYLGIKGTHVPQRILPNTFPAGVANPCPGCPVGFVYLTSNGNSNRHAGTIEIRRRQRNGFQASVQYTFAKAIDDAGLGGNSIAQNWLDLRGERGLSSFDQRHQVTVQMQYTSGMLAGIGSFWDGWKGALFKQWTLASQLTAGSGLPLTPVVLAPVPGTGITGSLRPDVTGASLYAGASGVFLNPLAFAPPAPGQWGNAARNSITGPGQFQLNASLARTFRFNERVSMDLRVDATNVLNHVTFPSWNTVVNSAQFGLPMQANAMRTLQPSVRVRF
jgi:trimeric autotransporter adhesin